MHLIYIYVISCVGNDLLKQMTLFIRVSLEKPNAKRDQK